MSPEDEVAGGGNTKWNESASAIYHNYRTSESPGGKVCWANHLRAEICAIFLLALVDVVFYVIKLLIEAPCIVFCW